MTHYTSRDVNSRRVLAAVLHAVNLQHGTRVVRVQPGQLGQLMLLRESLVAFLACLKLGNSLRKRQDRLIP